MTQPVFTGTSTVPCVDLLSVIVALEHRDLRLAKFHVLDLHGVYAWGRGGRGAPYEFSLCGACLVALYSRSRHGERREGVLKAVGEGTLVVFAIDEYPAYNLCPRCSVLGAAT